MYIHTDERTRSYDQPGELEQRDDAGAFFPDAGVGIDYTYVYMRHREKPV